MSKLGKIKTRYSMKPRLKVNVFDKLLKDDSDEWAEDTIQDEDFSETVEQTCPGLGLSLIHI